VVYLSPDADEVLPAALDEGTTYCVGGLVDRMVLKGTSVNHVRQGGGEGAGVQLARLPLAEFCPMHNPALNIDTVVRILLAVRETGDWAEALDLVIPQRRRVKAEDLVVQPLVPPAATLHVCNINPATPLAELVALAKAAGALAHDFEPASRPYAAVRFASVAAAAAGLPRLHGQRLGGPGGNKLRATYSKRSPVAAELQPLK
jgi:hypothetical protein